MFQCIESLALSKTELYGRFQIGPVKSGQGLTIGNALRRVLLGEIESLSIISVKIQGIKHEFEIFPGLKESIIELLFQLRNIVLAGSIENRIQRGFLNVKGPCIITAKDLNLPDGVTVADPDQYIATLLFETDFSMTFCLAKGTASTNLTPLTSTQEPILPPSVDFGAHEFYLDPFFSPLKKVNYVIEDHIETTGVNLMNKSELATELTQMQSSTVIEFIHLEVWTNGSIEPKKAFEKAIQKLLFTFQTFFTSSVSHSASELKPYQNLNDIPIEELNLSVRSYNCLKKANIQTLAKLVRYTKQDLLEIQNFGKKSAEEVVQKLYEIFDIHLETNTLKT